MPTVTRDAVDGWWARRWRTFAHPCNWLTLRDQVNEAIASGELVSVLDDWCTPFPGPFLYYPSRRQPPPALAAFVASWVNGASKKAAARS